MRHCSHGKQGYSLLGRWDVESQFRQVCAMSEKIPGKARPAAVGRKILGVGRGCGTVPLAGRDLACRAGEMWSPVRAGVSDEREVTSRGET